MSETHHPADEVLLGFTRALRAAGVGVTQDRAQTYLAAAAAVGLDDPDGVRVAGRATLCGSPDDLARHEQVFEAWFDPVAGLPREQPGRSSRPDTSQVAPLDDAGGADGGSEDADALHAAASDAEMLRHRDVASMTAAEKHRLARLFADLRPRPPLRRTSRRSAWHRGEVDAARTLRATLRRMGEPAEVRRRRRGTRPRRVVLLVDVSGSMSGYADALLRLSHRLVQGLAAVDPAARVETFTVGTRLTHLTAALRSRDAERAIAAAGEAVPDWSGGTRLGETLEIFLQRWGARGLARGAVVVIFSDGWERGDAVLLGEQVARLHRLAHRVVWVNPHRGKDGYQPVQQGVVAVLPHVDHFLAGHTLATYAELVEVISHA